MADILLCRVTESPMRGWQASLFLEAAGPTVFVSPVCADFTDAIHTCTDHARSHHAEHRVLGVVVGQPCPALAPSSPPPRRKKGGRTRA